MKRMIAIAALLAYLPTTHAFLDEIDASDLGRAWAPEVEPPPKCHYNFGWGRNTVTVSYEGSAAAPLDCTFTHSERVSATPDSKSIINAVYYQHYSCADGSRAAYSTNWIGSDFTFVHYPASGDRKIYCD